ncbi:hypothetical protein BGZ81_008731 [Podila clonocystis]|nr:hypothetical protein BGZ81_008731 [Podila clonocystis]
MSDPEIQTHPTSQDSMADAPRIRAEVYKSTAKPKEPLTAEEWANMKKPKVLIVGAGIGGLMLANLLQKGNVPFDIYERAKEVKPLGSAMSLGSSVTTLFKQIGIYPEFKKIGKPNIAARFYNEERKPLFSMSFAEREGYCGAPEFIVARPDLYDLLLHQIPKENIHFGKKVLSVLQNDIGVMIRCNDNSSHHGDILVGCDGAYSAVRQQLFKYLKEKKQLPASDDVPLPYECICLVGQTEVLDPSEFPELREPFSQATTVLGKSRPVNVVIEFLTKESSKSNDSFRNSEWGPEAAEAMCKEVRDLKLPINSEGRVWTLGDLIDRTPKNLISKVMLEEKVFESWHGGRTVLLGDACHKLNPSGGAGALSAMHDAVALSNWICSLETKDIDAIVNIFKEYRAERYPAVKAAFETSRMLRNVMGKNLNALLTRVMFRRMPKYDYYLVMGNSFCVLLVNVKS